MVNAFARIDPLVTDSERFALGWPRSGRAISTEQPSDTRPFGLRFALTPTGVGTSLPTWSFDPVRQIAVDAHGRPLHRAAGRTGSMKTTGPSPDGGGSTGNEEWTQDFIPDETDVP